MTEKDCLSYWLPTLQAAGVPLPRTQILRTDIELFQLLSGQEPEGWKDFIARLSVLASSIGFPCFLRTGQGSAKHHWKETCFVAKPEDIAGHVVTLVEWSDVVCPMGLPTDVWAVRELLPTRPFCFLPAYNDFPLVAEVRCFIDGGKVLCAHPYWPRQSIEEGFLFDPDDDAESLVARRKLPANFEEIVASAQELNDSAFMPLAMQVAAAFKGDGGWSVDLLPTDKGWFVTDMEEACVSFHKEYCGIIDYDRDEQVKSILSFSSRPKKAREKKTVENELAAGNLVWSKSSDDR